MFAPDRRTAAVGVALVAALACQGALAHIRLDQEATATIPPASILETLVGDLGFDALSNVDVTDDAELANQGVEPGDIVDVRLVEFFLEVTDPPGADLSFLDSLDVYVQAPDLPKVRIASATNLQGTLVRLDLEEVDLTDYAVSQSMTVTTDASGRRPDEATTVRAQFGLSVGVTSQGACAALQGDIGTGG
ncbi:MAG: hypothetical protein H6733_02190 [Alphaproteobacteria bacterium]|nr:hypothetical protein [Alphaproteobacteria bacterium]